MQPCLPGGSGHAPNRPEGTLRSVLIYQPPISYLLPMKTLFQTSISGRVPALPEKRFLINLEQDVSLLQLERGGGRGKRGGTHAE